MLNIIELSTQQTKKSIKIIKSKIRKTKNYYEKSLLEKELDYLEHLLKESDYNDCSFYVEGDIETEDAKPPQYDILDNYIEKEEQYFDFRTNSYKTVIKKVVV